MNWIRNEILGVIISCICLIFISAGPCQALERNANVDSIQQPPATALTKADHTVLKQRIIVMRSSADELQNRLDVLMKTPPSNRKQAREAVRETIARLKTDSMNISEQTSALQKRKLAQSDWAALHQSAGHDFKNVQMKLERLLRQHEALLKSAGLQLEPKLTNENHMKDDIKSKRSEVETKFQAGEQARNSDYNILLSIIQTMNQDLGIFNKAMM